jgi:excisionase family DNA binding protein
MTDELLSPAQAAERLGVSARRVRALIHEGRLPAVRVGGRHILRASDVAAFERLPHGYPKGRPRGKRLVEIFAALDR